MRRTTRTRRRASWVHLTRQNEHAAAVPHRHEHQLAVGRDAARLPGRRTRSRASGRRATRAATRRAATRRIVGRHQRRSRAARADRVGSRVGRGERANVAPAVDREHAALLRVGHDQRVADPREPDGLVEAARDRRDPTVRDPDDRAVVRPVDALVELRRVDRAAAARDAEPPLAPRGRSSSIVEPSGVIRNTPCRVVAYSAPSGAAASPRTRSRGSSTSTSIVASGVESAR